MKTEFYAPCFYYFYNLSWPYNKDVKLSYWQINLIILSGLLAIWFLVSFGFGIIWSERLDEITIGGFKLGFWFSQQGSIYFFVLIIFIYVYLMNKLDKKFYRNSNQDKSKDRE
jgi:putative solute:sodium symporter small subunit